MKNISTANNTQEEMDSLLILELSLKINNKETMVIVSNLIEKGTDIIMNNQDEFKQKIITEVELIKSGHLLFDGMEFNVKITETLIELESVGEYSRYIEE